MAKDKDNRPPVSNPPGGMQPPPGRLAPEIEQQGKDQRPPIGMAQPGTGPSVDNPPPQKGAAIQGAEDEADLHSKPGAGTNEATPDGQQYRPEGVQPPHQPIRPDQTTQGQRPDVGGSNPVQTHPDRPDIHGQDITQLPGGTDEPQTLKDARERADRAGGTGNVYRVLKPTTKMVEGTGFVTESDLPEGEDPMRLVRLGVLEPVGDLKSDPRKARSLGREGQEEVDRLHDELVREREENDRLRRQLDARKK